jgi:hypothetical protein
MYLAWSVSATMAGLMFYSAVENLHPSESSKKEGAHVIVCVILSALFTPLGTWFISVFMRMKKLPPLSIN